MKGKLLAATVLALSLASSVNAAVLKFTATSASAGVLGYLTYDESVFDGSNFQFVANTEILSLYFQNPITLQEVTAIGPDDNYTIFNSTGAWPTVVGGAGFTGGTDFSNGVWIYDTYGVVLAGSDFSDVSWSTSVAGVPEPASWAMMIGGFGLVGGLLRRRRETVVNV